MEQVGYQLKLIATGEIINQWGGVWGQLASPPGEIKLPSGDIVCAPQVGVEYQGCILDPWMMDPPPPVVPSQVPMWAVRTILQNDGLFDQAQALVDASTDNALKNVWEYGNVADRSSPAINALGVALGLTDAQIDQMFFDANALIV